MNDISQRLRKLEQWNTEREKVKPFIDIAVDCHNKARTKMRLKNYEEAANLYREAIENYKSAVSENPKYYLQELLERIDCVIEEHINNTFNLKTSGYKFMTEAGVHDFVNFIDNLTHEERRYIDLYDTAQAYLRIADFYYDENNPENARKFYNKVIDTNCERAFINYNAHFKIAKIQFDQARFKEALVSVVSALSFDSGNKEALGYLEDCLKKLHILDYKYRFLNITASEAKKLIMEVL